MAIGLSLMGLTYGPLGTMLSELFPTAVRYTGSSVTFNLAGIFGASLAPYAATWLARTYGLQYVGYYLTGAALLTVAGRWRFRKRETMSYSQGSGSPGIIRKDQGSGPPDPDHRTTGHYFASTSAFAPRRARPPVVALQLPFAVRDREP